MEIDLDEFNNVFSGLSDAISDLVNYIVGLFKETKGDL